MRQLTKSFIRKRDKGEVPGVWRKVFLEELGLASAFSSWTNTGRCGNETCVSSLEKHKGDIYAGCSDTQGHVWRYNKVNDWDDMGNPIDPLSGSVHALLSSGNELYAGMGTGRMRRFISPDNWEDCGDTYNIRCMFEYEGNVCAGVAAAAGLIMRWNGGTSWSHIGTLGGNAVRCVHLHTDGKWYGGCSNSGHLYRDDGVLNWTDLGLVDMNVNGIYSLASHKGELYIGTQMAVVYEDRIYKYNAPSDYTYCGYPGESNIIRCMVDYKDNLLVGTNDEAHVYLYRGGTVWEDISGRLNTQSSLWAFEEYGDKIYTGSKPHGRVYSAEYGVVPTGRIEITDYIADITTAEQRIEDRFNEFIPTTTTFVVTDHWNQDHHFFTQGETEGIFDKLLKATVQGYRIFIQEGITGERDEVTVFDAEVDIESVTRISRSKVEFTATGWLRDADRHDASVVADKDNPPFTKVIGLTVDYSVQGVSGSPGGKNIEISGEIGEGLAAHKLVSYCGGKEVMLPKYPGTGTIVCPEPNYKGWIKLICDYSATPDRREKDYFAVIEDAGGLLACGWWQNRSIDFLVNKLCNQWWGEGIGTRDINVQEIGGGVQQKMFVYLPPIYETGERLDVKITASKIIEYDDTTKEITMLVAVEWKKEVNNRLYKVIFNVETQERSVLELEAVPYLSRIAGIYETDGRWWILVGRKRVGLIEEEEWYATYFLRLDLALTQIDFTRTIPYDHTLPAYHYNLYSFKEVNGSDDFFCIRQEAAAGMVYTIKSYLYDIVLDTWSSGGTMCDEAYAYNRGTWAQLNGGSQQYYYYACKKQDNGTINQTTSYVMAYIITESTNYEIKTFASVLGTVVSDLHWNQRASGSPNSVFLKIQYGDAHWAYWLYKTDCVPVANGDLIRFFGSNNEDDEIYTSWQLEDDLWRLMFFYGTTYQGGNVQTEDFLQSGYFPNIDNPKIFKINERGDYFYCGFVTDKSNRVVPFLYIMGTTIASTVKEFETTDWSIKDALKYLAQGYLCYVYIPGWQKIRFYFRKRYGGTITLTDYKKQPRMKIWKNWADGIHIENSKYGLSEKRGGTFYKSKVFHIDNRLTSENSIGLVADWHYNFLCVEGRRKDFFVDVPFLIETEPMDKVIITLYDKDGNTFWTKDTIVYEASHVPWPRKSDSLMVNLKLLEIEGEAPIHELIGERRGGIA